MDIAALVISILSLIASLCCLVIMLAKNFFSTHQVQMVPVDPFKDMPPEIGGKLMGNPYKELGDPMTEDELGELEKRKQKLNTNAIL